MDVREKMMNFRKENNIDLKLMSRLTGVSSGLISCIEGGYVTHPDIARNLQKAYKLTDEETEMLMPENYRKSSSKYEPDKYKWNDDLVHPSVIPYHKPDEMDLYAHEHKRKRFKEGEI